jgi:hypothetical protein
MKNRKLFILATCVLTIGAGIGYIVFMQQQQLKEFVILLTMQIEKLNESVALLNEKQQEPEQFEVIQPETTCRIYEDEELSVIESDFEESEVESEVESKVEEEKKEQKKKPKSTKKITK